jgi:hypothetical protein
MVVMSDVTTIPDGRPVTHWLTLAVALTVLDAAATALWLELGIAVEGNPWLAHLVEVVGTIPAMAVRTAVGVALLVGLGLLSRRSRLARVALPAVTVVLGLVAVWHAVGSLSVL